MNNNESIKDTLDVIRKALEDDYSESENNILILNRKVNEDGTINIIKNDSLDTVEINNIIDEKLAIIVEKKFDEWFQKRLPDILDKYIKNKKL